LWNKEPHAKQMIKRKNEYTLKEVLDELVNAYRLGGKLQETRVINSWEKVVGGIFARHTTSLSIKKGILYVKLDSSVLRSELAMARSKLVDMLNKEVGEKVIEDIIFQ